LIWRGLPVGFISGGERGVAVRDRK
jgi:hypothetical protein